MPSWHIMEQADLISGIVSRGTQVIANTEDSQWSEAAVLPLLILSCKIVNSTAKAVRIQYLGKILICITTEL